MALVPLLSLDRVWRAFKDDEGGAREYLGDGQSANTRGRDAHPVMMTGWDTAVTHTHEAVMPFASCSPLFLFPSSSSLTN